jgi:hypothetical protein
MDPLLLDGGWEDVDLSLSAAQHGYERWYTPRVELYHLGAQSRRRTSDAAEVFNAWLLTRKWAAPTSPGRPFARDRSGAQIPRTMSSSL